MPKFELNQDSIYEGHTVADWNSMRHIRMQSLDIHQRPFAIDRTNGLVRPAGIFDTSQGNQFIGVYFTYHLDPTDEIPRGRIGYHCEVHVDPTSCIDLDPTQSTVDLLYLPAVPPGNFSFGNGRPVLRLFKANFSNATPGKHRLVFKFYSFHQKHGGPILKRLEVEQVIEKTIFVIKTTLSQSENAAVAEVPEGRIVLRQNKVGVFPWMPWDQWLKYSPSVEQLNKPSYPPWYVPIEITAELYPNTPFKQQIGPLPFGDPVLWKWLLGVLAVISTLLAAMCGGAAKKKGAQLECIEEKGLGQYSKHCTLSGPKEAVARGGLGAIFAMVALILFQEALKDEKDPFRIGEERTKTKSDEITIKEEVIAKLDYKSFLPNADNTVIDVEWTFRRFTQGGGQDKGMGVYEISDSWQSRRSPLAVSATVGKSSYLLYEEVNIKAEVKDKQKRRFGGDVYVLAWLFGPKDGFRALAMDDIGGGDFVAKTIFDSVDSVGDWSIHIIVQSIDQAEEHNDSQIKIIGDKGGILLNDLLERMDTKDCQFEFIQHSGFEIKITLVK